MARGGLEEAIRIVLETEGEEGLQALRAGLLQVAEASAGSADKAGALAAELEKLANTSTNIRNFTRLKATLADTGTALERARQRQRELNAELAAAENPTKKLTRENERAAVQVDRLTKLQNRQQAELARTTNALSKAGVDTENLGRAYADLQGEFAKLGQGAESASGALRKVGNESRGIDGSARKSAGALDKISKGLLGASQAALTAATALAAVAAVGTGAFFAGAVKSAATLEDALMEVRAVSGATAAEMEALKAAAEAGATTTRFTALEAAGGLGELARATGSATSAIEALPAALNLAQAAGIGVADAAQFITTTLTQFGLGATQASQVADVLAKAANATTADVRQLGDALTYAAPLAKQLGLDTEDTVAILGALADQGFRGERAGTALRNVFSELLEPSSAFAKALRDLGIESNDFATVIEQLGQSGERGREALQLLDAAARPAILSLVNEGGAGLRQLEADLRNAGGAAEETARQMGQSTNAATDSIAKSFDRARRSLVEPVLEPLRNELLALSLELEQFAKSPEFAEIKDALSELFLESAQAAKALLQEIDFKALAQDIRSFVGEASESMALFRENVGAVVATVETIGDAFSAWFNGFQTVILGAAAAVAKLLQLSLQAAEAFTFLPRKLQEFATGTDDVGRRLDEAIGGLGSVFEEFKARSTSNLFETENAFRDLVGAAELVPGVAGGLDQTADASGRAAKAAGEQAAAARDAAAAMDQQGAAAARTADASSAAADQASADAARLKQAFADLGIESQANLQRAAESARKNFDRIREAVGAGKATAEDARRALAAYAQAARAAVSDSTDGSRARVENEIAVQEAILGVNRSLADMGAAGKQAGQQVAGGASQAATALDQTAAAAQRAAQAQEGAGAAATGLASEASGASKAADGLTFSLGELSAAGWEALRSALATQDPLANFGRFARDLSEQQRAWESLRESTDKAAKSLDEYGDRRKELQRQYSFISDAQIDAQIQAEDRIQKSKEERIQRDRQAAEAQRQEDLKRLAVLEEADKLASQSTTRVPLSDNTLKIELEYPKTSIGGELSAEERRSADRMLVYILPKIMQAIARAKSTTVTSRARPR
ncbi:phage tail tape measure protein [Pseudoxanthomonas mexicana]